MKVGVATNVGRLEGLGHLRDRASCPRGRRWHTKANFSLLLWVCRIVRRRFQRAYFKTVYRIAAHLVEDVIPRVPVRQSVLSFPIPLRMLFAAGLRS